MLVGICGLAGAGKDTVYEILAKHGVELNRYGFADPIKELVNSFFGWGADHSNGELKEVEVFVPTTELNVVKAYMAFTKYGLHKLNPSHPMTGHHAFMLFQNTLMKSATKVDKAGIYITPRIAYQKIGTEYGRNTLGANVWCNIAPTENTIVTDVRFPNERDWLLENGGTLIYIKRDTGQQMSHESEQHIDTVSQDAHYVIDNNGTMDELEKCVLEIAVDLGLFGEFPDKPEHKLPYKTLDIDLNKSAPLNGLTDVASLLCRNGIWNISPYTHGLANGLLISMAFAMGATQTNLFMTPNEYKCPDMDIIGIDITDAVNLIQESLEMDQYNLTDLLNSLDTVPTGVS